MSLSDVPPATPASRATLAGLGTAGVLAFATYTNGADFMLLYVSAATMLLAIALLQLLVLLVVAMVARHDTLPVLPRVLGAGLAVMAAIGGTLVLPAASDYGAAAGLLCGCCAVMGAANGVMQATSAGLAGASGPALLMAQTSGVPMANLTMSLLRVAFKLAMPGAVGRSYRWFVGAALVITAALLLAYVVAARADPHLRAVLRRRADAAAAAAERTAAAARRAPYVVKEGASGGGGGAGGGSGGGSAGGASEAGAGRPAETLWRTTRRTGHYGVGQLLAPCVALSVYPGFMAGIARAPPLARLRAINPPTAASDGPGRSYAPAALVQEMREETTLHLCEHHRLRAAAAVLPRPHRGLAAGARPCWKHVVRPCLASNSPA